ncbi:MAG TPA: acetyl-CoA carboxylase biotin carboxylase subunit [Verrucomicrobiae bacterium]|nr:acetyl-CoA carboxylase biotin carboxylase subunit [Verrucomicrobiae bacterium]
MFDKILIANRGEIAVRIIRACRDLGIRTLAIYSEEDADSIHVQLADEAVCIGRGPARDSYLRIERIIAAAEIGDVDAIHPGYGFLSENPQFADVCDSCNIRFVGPSGEAMRAMGDKNAARAAARRAGVPITPGSDGIISTEQEAMRVAQRLGYPVMVKAAAGGGGRGMRPAHNDVSLAKGFHAARTEAEKAFGSGDVYIEKLIEDPRHIEIQILADRSGRVVSLGERDCSIQRRNQKLIEECPSPAVDDELRKRMGRAAIKLCHEVHYENAGTIEFLVDPSGGFYFMEMNTRIQVEHGVTEEVYGIDIVAEQIRIAAGEPISQRVLEAMPRRHAIEARINAEDPQNGFRPCPGRIGLLYLPGGPGIRVDSHAYGGYTIPSLYDSMIAKVIATGADRAEAVARLARALKETHVEGVETTAPFAAAIMNDPDFRRGRYSTAFVERLLAKRQSPTPEK